ncbi:MAG: hypothetical protein GWP91_18140 [Rhodobacterales bacterium]|nr:hypothetical protein [Rhodobacterales bacterium]
MAKAKIKKLLGVPTGFAVRLSNQEVESSKSTGDLLAILSNLGNLSIPGLGVILSVAVKVWFWQMKRVNKKHGNNGVTLHYSPAITTVPWVSGPNDF